MLTSHVGQEANEESRYELDSLAMPRLSAMLSGQNEYWSVVRAQQQRCSSLTRSR